MITPLTYRAMTALALAGVVTLVGCRKPQETQTEAKTAPKAVSIGDAQPDAPPPAAATATPAENAVNDTVGAPPGTGAPPPPPVESLATSEEIAKFNPPEPMNAYAKRGPGDYQAQLDLYNKVLRTWASRADIPATFKDLMATYNSPKPPEPPAGRKLIYDRATISVRLQ